MHSGYIGQYLIPTWFTWVSLSSFLAHPQVGTA